ncbi:MAG: sulfite reductase subunit A, partial [Armatimonadaceae bacterium]
MRPGFLAVRDFDRLFDILHADGRLVIAPVKQGNSIGLGLVRSAFDLPVGWGDTQSPGNYRLRE